MQNTARNINTERQQTQGRNHYQLIPASIHEAPGPKRTRRIPLKLKELCSRRDLDVHALGNPTNIILLPIFGPRDLSIPPPAALEESTHVNLSPSEMLENMRGETGLANDGRVAQNIEDFKTSSFRKLRNRKGLLEDTEYNELVKELSAGFTADQLFRYFAAKSSNDASEPFELSAPYSTDLYTRSLWRSKSVSFPDEALSHLLVLRTLLKHGQNHLNIVKKRIRKVAEPQVKKHKPKSFIADRIIRQCWGLRLLTEQDIPGELDLWIPKEHMVMLLHNSICPQLASDGHSADIT